MENKQKKKRKMNILGKLSIIAAIAAMMIVKYLQAGDMPFYEKLLEGAWACVISFFGGGVIAIVVYLGMYLANTFFNTIYDENKEPPGWELGDHMVFVFVAIVYIVEITGLHIVI